jgi:hypothetical protein
MNIVKKSTRGINANTIDPYSLESMTPALSAILSLFDISDVKQSKLRLSMTHDVKREKEIELAFNTLCRYSQGHLLHRIVFQLLVSLRDSLCPPHHKARFRNALLWTILLESESKNGTGGREKGKEKDKGREKGKERERERDREKESLRDLQVTLCDQLYQIPARNVQLAAEAWKVTLQSSSLQRLMEQVQQVTEVVTPRQQEEVGEGEQEGEGDEAMKVKTWLTETVTSSILNVCQTLSLLNSICGSDSKKEKEDEEGEDEVVSMIMSMSYQKMEVITKEDSNFVMANTISVRLHCPSSAEVNYHPMQEQQRDEVKDDEGEGEGEGKEGVEEVLDRVVYQNDVESLQATRVILLDNLFIYEEMLSDFATAIRSLIDKYLEFPKYSEGLQGMLYIDMTDENLVSEVVHYGSNLRKNYMSGLLDPGKFLHSKGQSGSNSSSGGGAGSNGGIVPDVSLLASRILYAQPIEAAHSWYEEFAPKAVKHQWNVNKVHATATSNTSSKRRKIGEETDIDLQAETVSAMNRFRFISSIYDIEKSGIMASKRVDRGNVVLSKQIYTGINNG